MVYVLSFGDLSFDKTYRYTKKLILHLLYFYNFMFIYFSYNYFTKYNILDV